MISLRRFGLAVAWDNWLVCDERQAAALVEALSRQALLAARNDEGPPRDERARLFGHFIRLYRRHVRLAALGEAANDFGVIVQGGSAVERAVRALPLELRESLLLVALEGCSHVEAAQALDIPLAVLIERLGRARAQLAASLAERRARPPDQAQRRGAPNLRLVK